MQWIETFILGMIAGWIGAMVFIPIIGRRLAKKREAEAKDVLEALRKAGNGNIMTVAEIEEVRDQDGNLVEPGTPDYEKAVEALRKQIPFPVQIRRPDKPDKTDEPEE